MCLHVRDHIPLEQGLRRYSSQFLRSRPIVRDHIPLEQGLRLSVTIFDPFTGRVRDHIPLEQGLRLDRINSFVSNKLVRDHIPLEQGLRLEEIMGREYVFSQRPYSIRTRIKTGIWNLDFDIPKSETIFH